MKNQQAIGVLNHGTIVKSFLALDVSINLGMGAFELAAVTNEVGAKQPFTMAVPIEVSGSGAQQA